MGLNAMSGLQRLIVVIDIDGRSAKLTFGAAGTSDAAFGAAVGAAVREVVTGLQRRSAPVPPDARTARIRTDPA